MERHNKLTRVKDICFCGKKIVRDKGGGGATCICGRVYRLEGFAISEYLVLLGFVWEYDPLGM